MFDYTPFEGKPNTVDEAIAQCVMANRILANEGVLDGYGHVSVRNPENANTFFQARAVAPEFVVKSDILEIDLETNIISDTSLRAYGERVIHAAILKARPDVNAVFHGHPHEVVAMSVMGIPIRSIGQFCGMFYQPLPLFDDYSPDSGMLITAAEDGKRIAGSMGNALGIVMRGHGFTMTGNSTQQMVMNAIFFRDNAKMQLMVAPLGEPQYLSEEEGKGATRTQYSRISLERCWNYWTERVKKNMPDFSQ